MLWYKGWFETRIKLAMSLGFLCLLLTYMHSHKTVTVQPGSATYAISMRSLMGPVPALLLVVCVWLAGAGITTQPAFQVVKGLHGSTLFTLSLPVSRFRLLAVRASIGWLELAGVVAALCTGLGFVSPDLRAAITTAELIQYGVTLLGCISALYFLSVLLATFLEDQWRVLGTMLVFFLFTGLASNYQLPAFVDIFRAMGKASPLIAHTMPWTTIAFSLCLSVLLFLGSLTIVQRREY